MLVVYLIVMGDMLVGTATHPGILTPDCGSRRVVLAVITLVVLLPLVTTPCVGCVSVCVCVRARACGGGVNGMAALTGAHASEGLRRDVGCTGWGLAAAER